LFCTTFQTKLLAGHCYRTSL